MADEQSPASPPEGESPEQPTAPVPEADAAAQGETPEGAGAEETSVQETAAAEPQAETEQPAVEEQPADEEQPAEVQPAVAVEAEAEPVAAAQAEPEQSVEIEDDEEDEPAPREKPAVPGAHLEVDIVPEGVDPLGRSQGYVDPYAEDAYADPYATEEDAQESQQDEEEQDQELAQPIATAAIDLASGARYRATGKRKSAIARVILRPGTGTYLVNGRTLEEHFPRLTLQRNIRQPLETVGYEDRMDVVARLHGGGISSQAGALRHGVSKALLEADPNLRGELKRRGFLTRDSRTKERKKAGLKKARKRPQFSKR
jgi:small subunit ribosomal protein S9